MNNQQSSTLSNSVNFTYSSELSDYVNSRRASQAVDEVSPIGNKSIFK